MQTKSFALTNHQAGLLSIWMVILFAAIIFSVFLHEDGHGVGAKLDGIHVSTGFNKVGNYGSAPDDPDFRTGATGNALWSGLLGPITTWLLAISFTLALYRFKEPSWGTLTVGALAIGNGLIRAVPMFFALTVAFLGNPAIEDEVSWGMWYVLRFCRPDLAISALDYHALIKTYPAAFLSDPTFWVAPVFSLAISLACIIPAYRHLSNLVGNRLHRWSTRVIFVCLPFVAYLAALPVLNWLDRLIRINW